ncbi:uncharacterized protein LOC128233755 isoform X2 [Mya arenaria]|uniref:uncharacterized protein LOC128233755 isoform X2 n=1 Tax=Mya arenaria TaxID=6604 RepID=UPI0022E92C2D|nr:uncharacterized protein LOC128233755 isoform X2 [Mya arenaria]
MHISPGSFISKQNMQPKMNHFVFILATVCSCTAKLAIVGEGDILIEFDEPLEITCTNDILSDVDILHQSTVVANCIQGFGCNIRDKSFTALQIESTSSSNYTLRSNDTINTDLCGAYTFKDLINNEMVSVNVSIKGFNNTLYSVREEENAIFLTTECTFHVSLSEMQIYWYINDNTTATLLDESAMDNLITNFSSQSTCSPACDTTSAYRFTFGLNITEKNESYIDAFIETKVFHPDYMNNPLLWQSSNTFRVKDNRPRTASSPKSGCNIWCKVGIAVGAAICSVASCCICCCVCKGWCVNKGKDKDRIASYRMSCITYVGAYFPDHCRKNKTNPGSNNATVLTDGQGTSELAVSIHEADSSKVDEDNSDARVVTDESPIRVILFFKPTDDKDLKQSKSKNSFSRFETKTKLVVSDTPTNTDESKSPAKVVLLEYRVSNRKFDDEQEEETLNTCRKYGKVEKCLMEVTDTAQFMLIRIFVEFEEVHYAITACGQLQEKCIRGEEMRASFYNLHLFNRFCQSYMKNMI